MNRKDILFTTSRFNASKVGDHFINPCCFGEDLAAWLQTKLRDKGIDASSPGQEDWGWYVYARYEGAGYFLGMNVNETDAPGNADDGEWRIMGERKRSFWQRIRKQGLITKDDALLGLIRRIVQAESDFTDVHIED
jgi:hypothetical protein